MQTIQSPNPFPNPPKPKPNPTKQHRIPTQHPIFQKTQKNQKSKIKQTNIPMIQKHNPTSKKFTKSQSLSNLSEENLRTYFTLCKNQQREREKQSKKKKKTKTKTKKNPKFLVLLRESERIQKSQSNFYALLFLSLSLSLSHCVRKN